MARTTKQKESTVVVTRAEKKDAAKNLIREVLTKKPYKHVELIEETAKLYAERFSGGDTENANDVKGRIGSILDVMKKDGDVAYEGGMYALKAKSAPAPTEEVKKETPKTEAEKPTKKTKTKTKKAEDLVKEETPVVEKTEKKTVKRTTKKAVKGEEKPEEKKKEAPLPTPPLQPIAPVAPMTTEETPAPIKEEKKTAKKRVAKKTEQPKEEKGNKMKNEPPMVALKEEKSALEGVVEEAKTEEKSPESKVEEKQTALTTKTKGEIAPKGTLMDMSFLFGDVKTAKEPVKEGKPATEQPQKEKAQEKTEQPIVKKPIEKVEEKGLIKSENKPQTKVEEKKNVRKLPQTEGKRLLRKPPEKPLTAEERLRENFLRKLRSLGGDYFEYYSVYLLERYSMKNGRRLESMRITAGDRDGGIDGEIELTDKLGFRETIYIQSKNWNPDKGDERLWVVGETLLQQFLGACACRQAREGKQHCRGIFITTSRFTPEAKRILNDMSDKIVGYDGEDLFDAAKECQFGVIYENGNWKLDEKLLSGEKAFFNMV